MKLIATSDQHDFTKIIPQHNLLICLSQQKYPSPKQYKQKKQSNILIKILNSCGEKVENNLNGLNATHGHQLMSFPI